MSIDGNHGLHVLFERANLLDGFYKFVNEEDMSRIVMYAMDCLYMIGINRVLRTIKQNKNEGISNKLRADGNLLYQQKDFKNAFALYNKALMYAPYNSEAMKLAYSNRSALLYTVKALEACVKDIDTCIGMRCSQDILKKLERRKQDCIQLLRLEHDKNWVTESDFAKRFFNFNEAKHEMVPSASSDLNFIKESNRDLPKVISSRDIDIGKVVAIENALVTHTDENNRVVSCYYCNKFTLNLHPCEGCCHALFCSESCRIECNKDYHNIECQIIDVLEDHYTSFQWRLTIKAALKMKNKSSWRDMISESYNIGEKRMRASSIRDTYDSANIFSLLSYNDHHAFIHGKLYVSAIDCAMLVILLSKVPSFFPQSKCKESMSALARIMMHLLVTSPPVIEIVNSSENIQASEFSILNNRCNYGWFSLTSKLDHSCEPELLVVALKDRVALITVRPVKKGTVLKISYLGYWMERMCKTPHLKQIKLFLISQIICCCNLCKSNINCLQLKSSNLSPRLRALYEEWKQKKQENWYQHYRDLNYDDKNYKNVCKMLPLFEGFRTKEHSDLFKEFRFIIGMCQAAVTENCVIGTSDFD